MDRLRTMERWDRKAAPRSTVPLVTIQKDGLFSLNEAAVKAMGEPNFVEIYYDRDNAIIAFAPSAENNPAAYPPRKQPTGAIWYVAGQMFTRHYDIDTTIARRYPVEVEDNVLFVNLNGPSTVATGVRARATNREKKGAEMRGGG